MIKRKLQSKLSKRQYELLRMLAFEYKRWRCRIAAPKRYECSESMLHLGCGDRLLDGWLNVDMIGADLNLDIATGKLPFLDRHFEAIVTQHVIEHLTLEDELLPLMAECQRILKAGGELWLSTPDMEKVSRSYIDHRCEDMIADRKQRLPDWDLHEYPNQHFMNDMFHQGLEHRNLFDFEMLEWMLKKVGFAEVMRASEEDLIQRFEAFPQRNDDYQSVYVKAVK